MAKSMMRYLPPNGTAGLLRFWVSGARREPCPPARIIPRTLGFMRTLHRALHSGGAGRPGDETEAGPERKSELGTLGRRIHA
ncbi:hypothetical protein GCM10017782_05120 [Deinococcus ficus]|nr:hypothetical protein GCM10017782_05120 [Deinococcus ficus]